MPVLRESRTRIIAFLVGLIVLIPVIAHAVLSLSIRMMGDDFCFTAIYRDYGAAGALDWWYHNWSAYYSAIIGQGLVGVTGFTRYLPALTIFAWVLAAWWAAYQVASVFGIRQRTLATFVLAALLVMASLDGTPKVYQSVYWTSGNITYLVPMIILIFHLGTMVLALRTSEQVSPAYLALLAGLAMLAGGFSPFYGVIQIVVFLIAGAVLALTPWRKPALWYTGISVLMGMISLIILYLAPGNAIRSAALYNLNPQLSIPELIWQTLFSSIMYFPLFFTRFAPFALLTTLVVSALAAILFHPSDRSISPSTVRKLSAGAWLATWLIVAAGFFTGLYSGGTLPPGRAYIIPQMALTVMVCLWGYLMGVRLRQDYQRKPNPFLRRMGWALLALALLLGPVRSALQTFALIPDFQTFAAEWDARDHLLRNTPGASTVEITPLTFDVADLVEVPSLEDNPDDQCVRDYYQLQDVEILIQSGG